MYNFTALSLPAQPDNCKTSVAKGRILVMTATDEQLVQILAEAEKILNLHLPAKKGLTPPAS